MPTVAVAAAAPPVDLRFDNASDGSGTVVSLVGHDTAGLLAGVLAAFATLGVQVVNASISTSTSGDVRDTFVVTGVDGRKLPEDELEKARVAARRGAGSRRARCGPPLPRFPALWLRCAIF